MERRIGGRVDVLSKPYWQHSVTCSFGHELRVEGCLAGLKAKAYAAYRIGGSSLSHTNIILQLWATVLNCLFRGLSGSALRVEKTEMERSYITDKGFFLIGRTFCSTTRAPRGFHFTGCAEP